ncbi:MAG TPA: PH domain-containing protein [Tepidisphaeraceae bacterium]|nr:PH domain-containing protein [Tepidisphaeraceae bacterium]
MTLATLPQRPKPRRTDTTARIAPEPCAFASEGAAAAATDAPASTSLAALLTRHILRDGELVILILKPSIWFVPLSSIKFIAAVLIFVIAAKVFEEHLPYNPFVYLETGIFLLAARLMWAVQQWTARLYVLTDMRVLSIAGVFSVNIFDCPLRKVAQVRLASNLRERLCGVGSIEITPQDESCPAGVWQTIARPRQVLEQVQGAVRKAKHNGMDG